ncbi:MAG TPA: hypothetical protein VMO17_22205 [Terriglobia bacterium]|nr:hypothetical protein [Terriglobia bacterium]
MNRRCFLRTMATTVGAAGATIATRGLPAADARPPVPVRIKAFCIDFNWLGGKFAPPGHWAEASPAEHVAWYEGLGANVIQTFAVSCNGYAWYKGGVVKPQPGLKHDFLPEVANLAHRKAMLAMGYFCIGANSKWGIDHPALSYGSPSTLHIPFTDEYIDYLTRSLGDAIRRTGMDGTMIDWFWNPDDKLRENGWLPAEQKLFTQLTGKAFPASGRPSPEDKLVYERKAIDRCWARLKQARDAADPKCVLWLSVNDLSEPSIRNSPLLREVDWVMNESPDSKLFEIGRRMVGPNVRMIQNLVGWVNHDAASFLASGHNRELDLYGFAEPRENSLPLPIRDYLGKPVDAFKGKDHRSANDYNIAALARFYRGMPLNAVAP